jgi:hypothetical protein
MDDAALRVNDTLSINNEEHLHVERVEIFTGDDEYNETDSVEITSHNDLLLIKQVLTRRNKPSSYRLRGEPGIRMFLNGESGEQFVLTLAHHKGSIHVSAKKLLGQREQV